MGPYGLKAHIQQKYQANIIKLEGEVQRAQKRLTEV